MSHFRVDVDVPRWVRRRYRRAPHGIELEGGVRVVAGPMIRKGKVHLLASQVRIGCAVVIGRPGCGVKSEE